MIRKAIQMVVAQELRRHAEIAGHGDPMVHHCECVCRGTGEGSHLQTALAQPYEEHVAAHIVAAVGAAFVEVQR